MPTCPRPEPSFFRGFMFALLVSITMILAMYEGTKWLAHALS